LIIVDIMIKNKVTHYFMVTQLHVTMKLF